MKLLRIVYRKIKLHILTKKAKKQMNRLGIPKVKDSLETLDIILNNNDKSVTRFGDGEFNIINGESIKFQEYDEALAKKLKEILKSNNEQLLVCIPAIFDNKIIKTLKYKSQIFWLEYIANNHNKYMKYIDLNKQYYDACFTRAYIRYSKEYNKISIEIFKQIKKIWNKKDILIVEGKFSRLGVGNDLFNNANSIHRILCPSKDAFKKYNEILSAIKKHHKDKLVLLSLGPTATVLANDLASENIRAIDLGHIDLEYEWFLNRAEERSVIKNKSVNEIEQDQIIGELEDKEYQKSILEKID